MDFLQIPGFLASGISCGIKGEGKKDLGLIYSEVEAKAFGLFTKNKIKAAPVIISLPRIRQGISQAILVNSGIANACTGKEGIADARSLTNIVSQRLSIPQRYVLMGSTGLIGKRLPVAIIEKAIPNLVSSLSPSGIYDFVQSIMTTDTFPKIEWKKGTIGGKEITVCGVAKGAGMIMPNMATMLAFVLTDINIEGDILKKAFREGVEKSFNSISIDGDTSTNDMAVILANGLAGNRIIKEKERREIGQFKDLLIPLLIDLAKKLIKDGEGATKFVEISLLGAQDDKEAKKGAMVIANSMLVKSALYGADPNWGRIMAALGRSKIRIIPQRISLTINEIPLVKAGIANPSITEGSLHDLLKGETIQLIINLGIGKGRALVFTTDLSPDYVKINALYST